MSLLIPPPSWQPCHAVPTIPRGAPGRSTRTSPSGAPHFQPSKCCISMPEVVRSYAVHEEDEAQHEHRHEEIILSDHDALLLLVPLPRNSVPLCSGRRCDGGNSSP